MRESTRWRDNVRRQRTKRDPSACSEMIDESPEHGELDHAYKINADARLVLDRIDALEQT